MVKCMVDIKFFNFLDATQCLKTEILQALTSSNTNLDEYDFASNFLILTCFNNYMLFNSLIYVNW